MIFPCHAVAILGKAEEAAGSQLGMGPQDLSTVMSKKTPWARNDLDGAPHPHHDQVHICLGHFGPRARNPPLCQGGSGFPAVVTISMGFDSATGLARETYSEAQGEEKEKRKLVHILVHT
jgi:hypothetical protein